MEPAATDTSSKPIRHVERLTLAQLVVRLLQRQGMFAAEAEIVASRMIEADQSGLHEDGAGSLPQFLDAMDVGEIDPRARVIKVTDGPAVALLDGSTGIGHVAATRGMLLAVEKASEVGTGTVVIKNSRHCGDVGGLARLAATVGLIGFVTSSLPNSVAGEIGDHSLAWGLPGPVDSGPVIVRESSLAFGESTSLVLGLLSAGLAGGDTVVRKRKTVKVANTVEYFIQAIHPDMFGSREVLFAKWGALLASRSACATAIPGDRNDNSRIPLRSADANALAERAAKIKFDVNW